MIPSDALLEALSADAIVSSLSAYTVRTYAFLAEHALLRPDDGWSWVSKRKIQAWVGCKGIITIRRACKTLIKRGFIREFKEYARGAILPNGKPSDRQVIAYRLVLALPASLVAQEAEHYGIGRAAVPYLSSELRQSQAAATSFGGPWTP